MPNSSRYSRMTRCLENDMRFFFLLHGDLTTHPNMKNM